MSRVVVLLAFLGLLIASGAVFFLAKKESAPRLEEPAEAVAEDDADDPDIEFLNRTGVGTDGPSLIKFLEDRSLLRMDVRLRGRWRHEERHQAA